MKIYLVGGAVRDQLLNRKVIERDYVVVGSTPEEMSKQGFRPVGKDFPVFLHPKTQDEYALARTERKVSRGYTGFEFYTAPDVTLEEDLKRRDLTINAIAQAEDGLLVDPYNGQVDIQNKILRHVSDAFVEDPVRILRVARFYARFAKLGFTIANETIMLMRKMVVSGEVNALTAERVWQELYKALQEPMPDKFFKTLRMCGALKVIFPEIDKLYGVPNPVKHHPEIDSGVHTMMVLQQAAKLSESALVRFAALVHDLGKALTVASLWPKHPGHEENGVRLVKEFCKRLRVPKAYKELALLVTQEHGNLHRIDEMQATTIVKFLEKTDAFRRPERFLQFLLACKADSLGRPGHENDPFPQLELATQAQQAANAVNIKPLLEKNLDGSRLAQEIHQLRVAAVKKVLV